MSDEVLWLLLSMLMVYNYMWYKDYVFVYNINDCNFFEWLLNVDMYMCVKMFICKSVCFFNSFDFNVYILYDVFIFFCFLMDYVFYLMV